jgi:hypothetical protein
LKPCFSNVAWPTWSSAEVIRAASTYPYDGVKRRLLEGGDYRLKSSGVGGPAVKRSGAHHSAAGLHARHRQGARFTSSRLPDPIRSKSTCSGKEPAQERRGGIDMLFHHSPGLTSIVVEQSTHQGGMLLVRMGYGWVQRRDGI